MSNVRTKYTSTLEKEKHEVAFLGSNYLWLLKDTLYYNFFFRCLSDIIQNRN